MEGQAVAGIVLQNGVPIQGAYQAQAQQLIEPMSVITRFCESMMIMCELSHFNKTNWNVSTYKFTSELLIEKNISKKKHKNAIKDIKTSIDKYSAIYKEYEMGGSSFTQNLMIKGLGRSTKTLTLINTWPLRAPAMMKRKCFHRVRKPLKLKYPSLLNSTTLCFKFYKKYPI